MNPIAPENTVTFSLPTTPEQTDLHLALDQAYLPLLFALNRRLHRCDTFQELYQILLEGSQTLSGCTHALVFTAIDHPAPNDATFQFHGSLGLESEQQALVAGTSLHLDDLALARLLNDSPRWLVCRATREGLSTAHPLKRLAAACGLGATITYALFLTQRASRPLALLCCGFVKTKTHDPGPVLREVEGFQPDWLPSVHLLLDEAALTIERQIFSSAIRAEQERTRAVVDATNDAILMLDSRQCAMMINRRAKFFFGLAERDVLGKDYRQLEVYFNLIFEEPQRFAAWLQPLLGSKSERSVGEFKALRPEPRLLQCFSAPVFDHNEHAIGRILVFRDITREREVDRMKNEFVSIVSHELRTPLTSIRGALQLVLGKHGPSSTGGPAFASRAHELLTISLSNTERLIRLINDILDISKIEQGRIQLRREPLNVEEICRVVQGEVAAFAATRDITIEMDLPPELPLIFADRDRTIQVLTNLLSNAIKFSSAGQRVLLSARHEPNNVCFAVHDWGRGIAPEDLLGIFQKFHQIDSSPTRDVGGTGLGLAICKALVEEHGGRIWVESVPAEGSIFRFTLPLATSTVRTPTRPAMANRILILIVSDAPDVRQRLWAQLELGGYGVLEAESDGEALQLIHQHRPALIVLDALLPHDDGFDLPQLLKNDAQIQQIPLLVVTPTVGVLPRDTSDERDEQPRWIEQRDLLAYVRRLAGPPASHVLVVDDDPHVRPVLVRLLQRYGLRVTDAGDGLTALAAVERTLPDLILLDIKMPGIDGYEVLRRLKHDSHTCHIPVIILTANDLGDAARTRVMELGAVQYLEKPIASEQLIRAIERVLIETSNQPTVASAS